jgi:hypothetical protein
MTHEVHLALRLMERQEGKGSFSRPTRIVTTLKMDATTKDGKPFRTASIFTFREEFEQMHFCFENSEISNFIDEFDCLEAQVSLIVTPFDFSVGHDFSSKKNFSLKEDFLFVINDYEHISPDGDSSPVFRLKSDNSKCLQVRGYLASAGGFACSISCAKDGQQDSCEEEKEAQVIITLGSKSESKDTSTMLYFTKFNALCNKTIFYLDFLRVMDYTVDRKLPISIEVLT